MNDAAIGKMFTDLEKAEAKLLRAFNKWAKCKARVRRFDAAQRKAIADELPKGAKPWPDEKGALHVPQFGVKAVGKSKAARRKPKR